MVTCIQAVVSASQLSFTFCFISTQHWYPGDTSKSNSLCLTPQPHMQPAASAGIFASLKAFSYLALARHQQ